MKIQKTGEEKVCRKRKCYSLLENNFEGKKWLFLFTDITGKISKTYNEF